MSRSPLRVFLSYTSELAEHPAAVSFVTSARSAIARLGHASVDMSAWSAADRPPRYLCEEAVSQCDVYVGIIGFRYGSIVADDPGHRSYVELEFDTAIRAMIPRLIFFMDEELDVAVPHSFHVGEYSSRQDRFRRRVQNERLVHARVRNPIDLENKVYQALVELQDRLKQSSGHAGVRHSFFMIPPRLDHVIERPGIMHEIVDAILSEGSGAIVLATALQGAGGFGKTVLASEICRRPEVAARFADGMLWVTIGEHLSGADLASKINDLCLVITGNRPTFSDPENAGYHLGEILGTRRCLLVVDDVWHISQIQPFLAGAPQCLRLITTRNRAIIPTNARAITVDTMEVSEARELLMAEVGNADETLVDAMLNLTGRWPVLVSLVNATLRRYVRGGDTANDAARRVIDRLRAGGPAALDVSKPELRRQAVGLTLEASFQLLTADDLERYKELSIFPEDVEIPLNVLQAYWKATGHLDVGETQALSFELADLSLANYSHYPSARVRLHDVLRSFLRRRCSDLIASTNESLLDAVAVEWELERVSALRQWWLLPRDHYLWDTLGYHLLEADKRDELTSLVLNLHWISTKILYRGIAAVDADLALVDDHVARELRRSLGQIAHLLEPFDPSHSVVATIISRLDRVDPVADHIRAFVDTFSLSYLESVWPLPDQSSRRLRCVLAGHSGVIWSCAISADGLALATAGDSGVVRIWDSMSGRLIQRLESSGNTIYCCVFDHGGRWVAAGGHGGAVWIWDVSTGHVIRRIDALDGTIYTCALDRSGHLLAVAGKSKIIRIWDIRTGQLFSEIEGISSPVYSCTFGPSETDLITGGGDGTIRIWSIAQRRQTGEVGAAVGSVYSIAIESSHQWLASAGYDGVVRRWDYMERRLIGELDGGSTGAIYACCVGSDGTWIATAGEDRIVRIWDVGSGRIRQEFEGHTGWLGACAASPDGLWLATAGNDPAARIWEISDAPETTVSNRSKAGISGCAVAPQGGWIVTVGEDRCGRIWNTSDARVIHTLRGHEGAIEACAVSRNSRLIATAGNHGQVILWDAWTGSVRHSIEAHDEWVLSCAFAADDELLVTCGVDRLVKLWNTQSGRLVRCLEGHTAAVTDCKASSDGQLLATTGYDEAIRIWDVSTGSVYKVLESDTGWIYACAWSPDMPSIAAVGDDGVIRIWDIESGVLKKSLVGHAAAIRGCAISREGKLLATVGDDHTLRIWNLRTGEFLTGIRVEAPLADVSWIASGPELCIVGRLGVYVLRLHLKTPRGVAP